MSFYITENRIYENSHDFMNLTLHMGEQLVKFNKQALEGASRPSSKLIVNMFSLCTS